MVGDKLILVARICEGCQQAQENTMRCFKCMFSSHKKSSICNPLNILTREDSMRLQSLSKTCEARRLVKVVHVTAESLWFEKEKDHVIAAGNRNVFERASETKICDSKCAAMSTVTSASSLQRTMGTK